MRTRNGYAVVKVQGSAEQWLAWNAFTKKYLAIGVDFQFCVPVEYLFSLENSFLWYTLS